MSVRLVPIDEMLASLDRVGLVVRSQEDCTLSHAAMAESLTKTFAADADQIARPTRSAPTPPTARELPTR